MKEKILTFWSELGLYTKISYIVVTCILIAWAIFHFPSFIGVSIILLGSTAVVLVLVDIIQRFDS